MRHLSQMMKKLILSCALAFVGHSAQAQSACDMQDATVYPVLETVKTQFLASDFPAFSETITRIMPHQRAELVPAFEQLSNLVPEGFDSCSTILQRVDVGGMVQEITTFHIKDRTFPIAVYLLAFPVRGELEIALFNFNTAFEPVVENLR